MIDERQVFERVMRGFVPPDDSLERFAHRRDRKRRNQRSAAGAVGIAVFVVSLLTVSSVALQRGPVETGPPVAVPGGTVPSDTGPRQTAPPAHASAAGPDAQESATCRFVMPRARAHLELTYSGDWIDARFVLHQMTLPGHRWRIVLRHASTGGAPPHADVGT